MKKIISLILIVLTSSILLLRWARTSNDSTELKVVPINSEEHQLLTMSNYDNVANQCYFWINSRFRDVDFLVVRDIYKYSDGDYTQEVAFSGQPSSFNFMSDFKRAYHYIFIFSDYKILKIIRGLELEADGSGQLIEESKKTGALK